MNIVEHLYVFYQYDSLQLITNTSLLAIELYKNFFIQLECNFV